MSDIVERLRDPEQGLTSSDRFHLHKDAADEIERLTKAVAELDDVATAHDRVVRKNKRLKAALREIAENTNHTSDYCRRIARAALEGSDEALFPTKKICPECGQPMREGGVCDHIPF